MNKRIKSRPTEGTGEALPPISFQEKITTGLSHIKLSHFANKHTGDLTAMNEAALFTLNIHILDK